MSSTLTECPNCHTTIKGGIFNTVSLLDASQTKLINGVLQKDSPGYCTKCGLDLYQEAGQKLSVELDEAKKTFWKILQYIPVISAQNPLNWNYEVLTMVTGQSTTGTGVFSEFTSSFTDFFGAQSGSYNQKLKAGEGLCFAQLRTQALEMGGNAVIATDIDYSEVGGDKGMLMVCMAGTAVRLLNPDVLGPIRAEKFIELPILKERLKVLQSLSILK